MQYKSMQNICYQKANLIANSNFNMKLSFVNFILDS